MVYQRKLSPTEAKRHFVYITFDGRGYFPPAGQEFKVVIGKHIVEVKVDSKSRVWGAMFWDRLPHWNRGDTITFTKNKDGSYTVMVEG
jgi:hypothetical protein